MTQLPLTLSELIQRRAYNQGIAGIRHASPLEVVSWLGAVQAQDYPAARWAVGARLAGSTQADVEAAVARREIVRTWALRGTLHLLAAADVRWILELVGQKALGRGAANSRRWGLDGEIYSRSNQIMQEALQGGKALTRPELAAALEHGGVSTQGLRMNLLLYQAALSGLICFGAMRGKQETFVLLDEWLPPAPPLEPSEGLANLARRYFASHGPATLKDFSWWSGLHARQVQSGLELIRGELAEASLDGKVYHFSPSAAPAEQPANTLRLLPDFDEYLVGYTDRSAVLDPEDGRKYVFGTNTFSKIITVDGLVCGIWKRTVSPKAVTISHQFFDKKVDPAWEMLFEEQAQRFAGFLGIPLRTLA